MSEYWEDAVKERHQHQRRLLGEVCRAVIVVAGMGFGALAVWFIFSTITETVTSGHRREERVRISRNEACGQLADPTLRTLCIVQGAK